jgi:hypothetical protein
MSGETFQFILRGGILLLLLLAVADLRAAVPVRGLSTVPARNVSAGYLNAIRMGTGTSCCSPSRD